MKQKDKDEGVLQGSQLPYQCWKVEVSGLFGGGVFADKSLCKQGPCENVQRTAALYLGKVNAVCRANSL